MKDVVKFFLAPRFSNKKEDVRILRSYQKNKNVADPIFKRLPSDWDLSGIKYVDTLQEADFVLIPQAIKRLTPAWLSYLDTVEASVRGSGLRIIVFVGGDLGHKVHLERKNIIVCKGTAYASGMMPNEILFPGYAEDLGEEYDVQPRAKGALPTVSFCGYAGFPNWRSFFRYFVKNFLLDVCAAVTRKPLYRAFKRGIYFRRTAMRYLTMNPRIRTSFVIRDSFSGVNLKDPKSARDEYIRNMMQSDFVLCPKGDGNYSIRFFEALSLGRIPILIDTDIVLPLEKSIDYSKFVIRIPHTDLSRIGDIIADFFEAIPEADFIKMQLEARSAFKKYLRYDSFFNTLLPVLKRENDRISSLSTG